MFSFLAFFVIQDGSALAQGTVIFDNYIQGSVIAHVYIGGAHQITGNGPNDYPPGTQDWTGFTGLLGTGYTAQLWAANGANQPESALQAAFPTTTFQTVPLGAGVLVPGGTVTLPGVPGNAVATISLRVWDNKGGTVASWDMAQVAGVALGESALFNSLPVGEFPGFPPELVGLVSFNIHQVPEPSSLALAGMGSAALWVMRRRKRSHL